MKPSLQEEKLSNHNQPSGEVNLTGSAARAGKKGVFANRRGETFADTKRIFSDESLGRWGSGGLDTRRGHRGEKGVTRRKTVRFGPGKVVTRKWGESKKKRT